MADFKASLLDHWKRVNEYSVACDKVLQGYHTPPPLQHFVVSAPLEDSSWSETAQRKIFDESPWLSECRFFESILFEPPDNPSGSLTQALFDSVKNAGYLTKIMDKTRRRRRAHRPNAPEQTASDREPARRLHEARKGGTSLGTTGACPYGPQLKPSRIEHRRAPASCRRSRSTGSRGAPPLREQWRAKAPPATVAGLPLEAARSNLGNPSPHRTGQPLQAKPRAALELTGKDGADLRPTVAATLRRVSV